MTVLDKPEQISMWVLVSRRHQVQMHLKGLTQKGIIAALKRDIGNNGNRVKDYVVPIEFAISEAGGQVDYKLVNVHICEILGNGLFKDLGVFPDPDHAAENAGIMALHMAGRLEIMLTTDEPREATGQLMMPA